MKGSFGTILLVGFSLLSFIVATDKKCENYENCDKCIQQGCSWCANHKDDPTWRNCFNDIEKLNYCVNPQDDQYPKLDSGEKTVIGDTIDIKLAVGKPKNISFSYTHKYHYPLDLFYLMDFTLTMYDDKETMRQMGSDMFDKAKNFSTSAKQGFGRFIDKPVIPFAFESSKGYNNPCGTFCEGKARCGCERVFGFHNEVIITSNLSKYEEAVEDMAISSSSDFPDGGLDALMQVLVCEQMKWRNNSRKVVIMATDDAFHIAGDGKLGGIVKPNSCSCHLDDKGYYTNSAYEDYPSVAQIDAMASENSIIVIFAVTANQMMIYGKLADQITGAKHVELKSDSSDILEIVQKTIEEEKKRVRVSDNFPAREFEVVVFAKCQENGEFQNVKECSNLPENSTVEFKMQVTLKRCPEKYSSESFKISYVGLPLHIKVNVEKQCGCDCSTKPVKNSKHCSSNGDSICGLCECDSNFIGRKCECEIDDNRKEISDQACINPKTNTTCSGEGYCNCGQCICHTAHRSGHYCECDDTSCRKIDGLLCGNNGACKCGKCECNVGWSGDACECEENNTNCKDKDGLECSGFGKCQCNKCKCENGYTGDKCETCAAEECKKCKILSDCVSCKFSKNDCETQCSSIKDSKFNHYYTAQVEKAQDVDDQKVEEYCETKESNGCTINFGYTVRNTKSITVYAQSEPICPDPPPYGIIFATLVAIIVLIGVLGAIGYCMYIRIVDKREYAKFEEGKAASKWTADDNPLYKDPVSRTANPLFKG